MLRGPSRDAKRRGSRDSEKSLKIPTFYLQRIDMEIGCEHVPRDNRLLSITRIRPAAAVGKLVAPPRRQPEPGIPISQTDKVR